MTEEKATPLLLNTVIDITPHVNTDPTTTTTDSNCSMFNSHIIRKRILDTKIYPMYMEEIDNSLKWRDIWARMSSCFFTVTFIIVSVSTIVSFSAPQFPTIHEMSYLAGCFGVLALISDRFAHYCTAQSTSNTKKVNILLKSIGINDIIPDIANASIVDPMAGSIDDVKAD
ncbi:MAG: hypothetical protein Gaeavirus30_3 [Gaeavirus sp.]|uniref:Uncharacterized protein n=1 Tax=Gaeavirus sp. TaxID=2487767 RepID=A0A3G5A399_9VIRU|nr:MAG: hypothetical protein Gaeavirus30_3 [Gaeavirus sp.]